MRISSLKIYNNALWIKPNFLNKQSNTCCISNNYCSNFDNSSISFAYKSLDLPSFKSLDEQQKYKLIPLSDLKIKEESLGSYKMLDVNAPQYLALANDDKEALVHLVKAARILNDVYLRQDSVHNIPFKEYLEQEFENGNKSAEITLKLFNAQKGAVAKDMNSQNVKLSDNISSPIGKGFYPEDLTKEEFHSILIKMLKDGQIYDVKNILNQRSMVVRDKDRLKAIDYTEFFKKEFFAAADELMMAASKSTNDEFNKYLYLQAAALLINNEQIDAYADKAWAKLQDTPLEFTISRESYDDRLTLTVTENEELKKLLDKHGIIPYAKDNFGVRVGIVNKKKTEYILQVKEMMPLLASFMPYHNQYKQAVSGKNNNQTMVDVDIVDMQGGMGAFRGTISLASNLPNNDKLAIQQGGGKRNVYHIQVRNSKNSANVQEKLDAILDKSFHKYFDVESLHDFTILHENLHSLGPKENLQKLGLHKNVLEEHKADVGAFVMLDILTKRGFYTPLQQKKIITSTLTSYVLKNPDFENAHRKRNVMQHNYYIQHGGIKVDENGKMSIDFEKVTELSKQMLDKVVKLQMLGDIQKAKAYIDEYAVWTEKLQRLGQKLHALSAYTNYNVDTPLADRLMAEYDNI